MRYRFWIAALGTAAMLLQGLPAQGAGKDLFHHENKNQAQIDSCVRQRAWMAYFKSEKGELAPVRETLNTDHDQDWIGLRFTDYDGPRIRLGVLKVINKAPEAEDRGGSARIEVPVSGIQEMLTVALYNSKRFDVIEQQRVQEIEIQQRRQDVFEPSPTSIINIGKVLGAQYLVYGTVNEWSPERAGSSTGSSGLFKTAKQEAEVAISFTLADVGTGQVLYTTAQRARLGATGHSWNAPGLLAAVVPGLAAIHGVGAVAAGASGSTAEKTPVSYAINACANKAAFEIANFLRNRKWKGSVVEIAKADVFVNAGSQQGMAPQTKLTVQAVQRIIKDRESGTILGEDLRGIGTLEIIAVQTGFSVARIVDGCTGIKVGDRVELATPSVPTAVPPECAALDVTLSR